MQRKLQIFISATQVLDAEKRAAIEAVLRGGDIPAGLLLPGPFEEQRQAIERWIDASDAHLFLLGAGRGPLDELTGRSRAELELDYAKKQGKPTFAVVMSEEHLLHERLAQPGVGSAQDKAYSALRQRLIDEGPCSFYEGPKDVKLAILETLGDWKQSRKMTGWIAGNEVIETAPLIAEIGRVSAENESLRARIALLEQKLAKGSEGPSLEETLSALQATKLTIPAAATGGRSNLNITLAGALFAFGELLISGVANGYGMTDQQKYLFFNLLPKLAMHNLAEKHKVPGKAYEQFELSKLGLEVLKRLQALELESKRSKLAVPAIPVPIPVLTPIQPPAPVEERLASRAKASRAGLSRAGTKKS